MINDFIIKVVAIIGGLITALFVSYNSGKKTANQKAESEKKDETISNLQTEQQTQSKLSKEVSDVQNKTLSSSDASVDNELLDKWTRD